MATTHASYCKVSPCSCGADKNPIISLVLTDWDHIRGLPPELTKFISTEELFNASQARDKVHEVAKAMAEDGATWGRLTQVPGGVWIEGWTARPFKETPSPQVAPPKLPMSVGGTVQAWPPPG